MEEYISQYTVNNGSLLYQNNVSLLEHVSKIVSILLSKLAIVPILTHRCATVTTHFNSVERLYQRTFSIPIINLRNFSQQHGKNASLRGKVLT